MKIPYLEFDDLTIGYGSKSKVKIVASGLSASINAGELVCLLGSNGTGKSTLIRTLCGFQKFYHGQAYIEGKKLELLDEKSISFLLSVVLTDRVHIPNATVKELVAYGRSPYTGLLGKLTKTDMDVVELAITQCGLMHKCNDILSGLSDGERQKVFIAKALAQDTPIVILDEPTAFLDLSSRVEVLQLLREIASRSGKAILLSTHDLDLALQMADRLWLLKAGGPMVTGSPEDLIYNNVFQDMFQKQGIVFDNRTGLFRVEYPCRKELPVKGHGFEYVLLRRSFARKGIKIVHTETFDGFYIYIDATAGYPFCFFDNNRFLFREQSVEIFTNKVSSVIV